MSSRPAAPCQQSRSLRRSAFTLIEVLIVGVLVSVLMLGVWSLFRTWGRLYERGERRVEKAQLIRSLSDRFTDDLHAVTYVAPPRRRRGSSASSSSSSRRLVTTGGNLALVGESTWMVLEVLQPANPFHEQVGSDSLSAETAAQPTFFAPELQRVIYTFEPPAADPLDSMSPDLMDRIAQDDTELVSGAQSDASEPFSGLLRLVVAFEYFDYVLAGESATQRQSSRSQSLRDAVFQLREMVIGEQELDPLGTGTASGMGAGDGRATQLLAGLLERDEVPEVSWMEFRYFDGSTWRGSWNSRSDGRLPVAVEIRFELREIEARESEPRGDGETELVDANGTVGSGEAPFLSSSSGDVMGRDRLSGSLGSGLEEAGFEETPYHRCVVYLEPAPSE